MAWMMIKESLKNMQVSMQVNKCDKRRKRKFLSFALMAFGLFSCSYVPVVKGAVADPREYVRPDTGITYTNGLVVNDVGDGELIDVRSSFDFSDYGDNVFLAVSTVYYTVGSQTYDLQEVGVASDLISSQYSSFSDGISAGVVDEWSLFVRRTANQISFYTVNSYLGSYSVDDFTLDSSAYTNGNGFLSAGNGRYYYYYSVYFPNGAPTEFRCRWILKALSVPFNNFMSGYTTAGGDMSGLYTYSEYIQYGQSEYNRGKEDGLASRDTTFFDDLAGAIVDVPINVLAGLSVFTVYDTPIVGIIVTFLLLGVVLWILKRILAR